MPLDLHGFVTKENEFAPLYRIGDDIRANNRLQQQQARLDEQSRQREEANKRASSTYLQSYLNPKHFLTGTVLDPVVTTKTAGILQKAMGMLNDGLDVATITYAISPDVEDLSKSSENLKQLQRVKQEHLKIAKSPQGIGIDADKYGKAFDQAAYFNPDGSMKDLASIDASEPIDQKVLQNPEIYNNDALDTWIAKSGKETTSSNIKRVGADGRTIQSKVDITKPAFMVQETNADGTHKEFVPQHEIATDEDAALIHSFKDEKGNEVKAPVRIVTDEVFNALPPTYLAKLKAEVQSYASEHPDIDMNSPQAENFAKALAYDDLKNSGKKYSTIKSTDLKRDAPTRAYSFYHGGTRPATETEVPKTINVYDDIDTKVTQDKNVTGKGYRYTRFNSISPTAGKILLEQARDYTGRKSIDYADVYLDKDENGQLVIRVIEGDKPDYKTDKTIPIDEQSLNTAASAELIKLSTNKGKTQAVKNIDMGGNRQVPKTKSGLPVFK